jgi:hypothetical protein
MKSLYKYIPYEEFNIVYFGKTEDVYEKLKSIIETDYNKKQPKSEVFGWKVESDKTFGGIVFEDRFEAERLTAPNQNSFRPLIFGELIKLDENRVNIKVIQKLPDWILGISVVLFLGGLFGSITTIIYGLKGGYYIAPFFSILFPFFIYILVVASFKNDSRMFREHLNKAFMNNVTNTQ